jgi:fucose permease
MSSAVGIGTSKGLGLHGDSIPATWWTSLLVAEYAAIVLYNPAVMAAKTSILLLYLDVARYPQKFLRIGSYITLVVVNIGGVVLTFVTAFQCGPVQAAYNLAIKNPSCTSIESIYLASAPINVATDLAILILPIPVLTTLSLPLRQKAILILTFLLGVIFVTVIDVARVYYMQLAADDLQGKGRTTSLEFSYNISLVLMWSAVEINVGIVCACVPTLKPLMKLLIPKAGVYHASSSANCELVPFAPYRESFTRSRNHSKLLRRSRSATGSATAELVSVSRMQTSEYQEPQMCMSRLTAPDTGPAMVVQSGRATYHDTEASIQFQSANTESPKCMLDLSNSETAKYCILIATLLFLMGATFAMLFALNGTIFLVPNKAQAVGLSSTSYAAAVVGPLLGYWVLSHVGIKATFVTALGIVCVGTLMFWPSGALRSYSGLVVSTLVVGVGLSLLDVASYVFLILCGPTEHAVIRLLLGQAVANTGSLFSFVLSQKIFFTHVDSTRSLIAIEWAYLGIALFTVLLGLLVHYTPLPEITDSELDSRGERLWIGPPQKYFGKLPIISTSLAIAMLSTACGAAASACLRTFITSALSSVAVSTHTSSTLNNLDFNIVLTAAYVVGHLILAFFCFFIPPRVLLLFTYTCGITCSVLIMRLEWISVNRAQAMTLILGVFIGPIPNFCIAIGLRGLGRRTKLAACLLESSAAFGACVFPFVALAVLRAHNNSARYSFCVVIALFVSGTVFPLYLNLVRLARPKIGLQSGERL